MASNMLGPEDNILVVCTFARHIVLVLFGCGVYLCVAAVNLVALVLPECGVCLSVTAAGQAVC